MEHGAIEPRNAPQTTWPPSTPHSRWIAEQIAILAEAFGESLTPVRIRLYASDLADLSREQLAVAFVRARRELKFFPRISEIRELAGASNGEAEARAAWDVLMDFVSRYVQSDVFGNYSPDQGCRSTPMPILSQRILDTVRRSGSWRAFKCMTPSDFPFQQKRFFEEFKAWEAVNAVPIERLAVGGEPRRALAAGFGKATPCATDPKGEQRAAVHKEFPKPAQIHERRKVLSEQAERLTKNRRRDSRSETVTEATKPPSFGKNECSSLANSTTENR